MLTIQLIPNLSVSDPAEDCADSGIFVLRRARSPRPTAGRAQPSGAGLSAEPQGRVCRLDGPLDGIVEIGTDGVEIDLVAQSRAEAVMERRATHGCLPQKGQRAMT